MPQALALPHCLIWVLTVWQVLALIHKLLMEEKLITQREAYYTLVQYFKHQSEFNDTLQGGYIDCYVGVTSPFPTIPPYISPYMPPYISPYISPYIPPYMPPFMYRCGSPDWLCAVISRNMCQQFRGNRRLCPVEGTCVVIRRYGRITMVCII